MYDIAGLRMMCHMLRQRQVVEERDYINNTKQSGYRSYHVIIEYPIETLSGQNDIS